MMFNATFNNILAMSWHSVLLVEKTGGHVENHRPVASHDRFYHIWLDISPRSSFELTTLVIAYVIVNPTTIRYGHDGSHN
jgi:hypothetical protein